MAYIGTTPTKVVSRQSVVDYRYIATEGQTAFTGADLNNQVLACNPADMDVYLNGVRLDVTDWSATATTLTLAVGATAGDEVTVAVRQTFEVADTYAKTTADDRFVNAAGDTMTGDLYIAKTGTGDPAYINLHLSNIGTSAGIRMSSQTVYGRAYELQSQNTGDFIVYDRTAEEYRLVIDAAGRVMTPYQPAFSAYFSAAAVYGSNATLVFPNVIFNQGGHYNSSNGRFTAPAAGVYLFNWQIMNADGTSNTQDSRLAKNGTMQEGATTYIGSGSDGTAYRMRASSSVLKLNAGDYIQVYTIQAGTFHNAHTTFSGYLIG